MYRVKKFSQSKADPVGQDKMRWGWVGELLCVRDAEVYRTFDTRCVTM